MAPVKNEQNDVILFILNFEDITDAPVKSDSYRNSLKNSKCASSVLAKCYTLYGRHSAAAWSRDARFRDCTCCISWNLLIFCLSIMSHIVVRTSEHATPKCQDTYVVYLLRQIVTRASSCDCRQYVASCASRRAAAEHVTPRTRPSSTRRRRRRRCTLATRPPSSRPSTPITVSSSINIATGRRHTSPTTVINGVCVLSIHSCITSCTCCVQYDLLYIGVIFRGAQVISAASRAAQSGDDRARRWRRTSESAQC